MLHFKTQYKLLTMEWKKKHFYHFFFVDEGVKYSNYINKTYRYWNGILRTNPRRNSKSDIKGIGEIYFYNIQLMRRRYDVTKVPLPDHVICQKYLGRWPCKSVIPKICIIFFNEYFSEITLVTYCVEWFSVHKKSRQFFGLDLK